MLCECSLCFQHCLWDGTSQETDREGKNLRIQQKHRAFTCAASEGWIERTEERSDDDPDSFRVLLQDDLTYF